MKEKPIAIQRDDGQRMSSLEIAAITRKPHNDLMKAIRKMEIAWEKITQGNFSLSTYTDAKGEARPMYLLTKVECLYVATKFNDEARAKLVLRWEQLENEIRNPSSSLMTRESQLAHAVLLAQQMLEEQSLMLEEKQRVIEEQRPKVKFADAVTSSEDSILISEMAKLLTQNGYEIGRTRLFRWLRENGYIFKHSTEPIQKWVERGIFDTQVTIINTHHGQRESVTTKVTGKGQQYFMNIFINN